MKRLSLFTLATVVTAMFVLPGFQADVQAKSISLNYANFPPAPTFPGGTLLGAKGMMDGIIAGQADIGCLCMAYQPGRFMVTNAVSLPVGIPDSATGSLVLLDLYRKYKPASFDKVKVLTMFTTAPANIMCKAPVRTLEDIKGMDLRASGGAAEILKAWGANQMYAHVCDSRSPSKGCCPGSFLLSGGDEGSQIC